MAATSGHLDTSPVAAGEGHNLTRFLAERKTHASISRVECTEGYAAKRTVEQVCRRPVKELRRQA